MTRKQGTCDVILRGGSVIDGLGRPAVFASVALSGDRITAVGDLDGWEAGRTIDVSGLAVAPGFIDMHSHSDLALLVNGRAESKIRQGVTTEVIGQCGFSPAPSPKEQWAHIRELSGWMGAYVDWRWETFGQYLDALADSGVSVNVVPLVGHSMVRTVVMGEENRAPTGAELAAMADAVRAAMDEGAFGMSTGLVYAPGMWAETEELIALARAMSAAGGIYFSHLRNEGPGLLDAIGEAVRIGREAGVGVQIAHLKASGEASWGRAGEALAAIEQARARGEAEVSYDAYPYTAWNTGLGQLLPAWAREGGSDAVMRRLRDPETRARIRAAIEAEAAEEPCRWERRLLASVETEANRGLQGLTLAEVARRRGKPVPDVVMDLLIEEDGQASMVGFAMSEEDVRRILAHPIGMIGSDSAASAPYGRLGESHPHPRTYGTFPRVLGHYARDEGIFSLEEAVAKMTSRPAAKLGLADRGRIAPGVAADITVFDPAAIADQADYTRPHQYPVGIRYVIVNGVVELDGEAHQDRRPGRVIRRG